ncbi:protein NUCLEAR FUSION DEFECTIVE 4-like isoform X2 [Cucurbita maxima]|uniref:Protein NUCLEAR FUSION DEFECTIVE 4-like isoform X2 n=1 Tax=Cucurbita maxima TaxID=3661 RepID=A0A6J1KEQ9_CUCMA|nr:protein NUCLEAR FUSION DEFECTIVE 4-like isoform X2 [Cucurbita maxima]
MKIKHRKPQNFPHLPVTKQRRMMNQPGKWVALMAAIWIQAFTGTNFDFPSYSSNLKAALGMSQVELNYLAVASDVGKAFGWCSGIALLYFPSWVVMLMAASMGFLGYGLQWLLLQGIVSLPYSMVYLLCLLAGCSICWFNTICYVSCIQKFPANRALALSLIVSFNGVSAALYTLMTNAVDPNDASLYLLLNALVPLIISVVAFFPILHQPPAQPSSADATRNDSLTFICLYITAVITGLYLITFNSTPSSKYGAQILLAGAFALLLVPLCLPGIWSTHKWLFRIASTGLSSVLHFRFNLVNHELQQELINVESERSGTKVITPCDYKEKESISRKMMGKENLTVLEEEHSAKMLVRRLDFWLYFVAYFCGGTIGLVYSNNLGQISQSLGYSSLTSSLVTLYSSCSFFGRLISAGPDFMREKVHFARTGWLALALVPNPIAFILLAASGSEIALQIGTGLIGLSSGFMFSASVSITSELFGPNSSGVNHNILITNIPLGSFLYGVLAAVSYDSTAGSSNQTAATLGDVVVCIGRKCYLQTFIWWACISIVGLASCFLLFRRTKPAYDRHYESNPSKTQPF